MTRPLVPAAGMREAAVERGGDLVLEVARAPGTAGIVVTDTRRGLKQHAQGPTLRHRSGAGERADREAFAMQRVFLRSAAGMDDVATGRSDGGFGIGG